MRRRLVLAAMAAVMVLAATTAGEAQSLSPLVVNWQQYFELDWRVLERGGQTLLTGHVLSIWKDGARWMQLLVNRVDARGALIDQRLVWLPAEVPRGGRVYFEVRVEPAAAYQVAVYSFESPSRPP